MFVVEKGEAPSRSPTYVKVMENGETPAKCHKVCIGLEKGESPCTCPRVCLILKKGEAPSKVSMLWRRVKPLLNVQTYVLVVKKGQNPL